MRPENVILADKNEAWMLEVVMGKNFVAKRVGKAWEMAKHVYQNLAKVKVDIQPKEISRSSQGRSISVVVLANPNSEAALGQGVPCR
jgi:hypothetical protein